MIETAVRADVQQYTTKIGTCAASAVTETAVQADVHEYITKIGTCAAKDVLGLVIFLVSTPLQSFEQH